MAYSIKGHCTQVTAVLLSRLRMAIIADGRFTAEFTTSLALSKGPKQVIELRMIRLQTPKPYCGNHPGPCRLTGMKKRRSTCLEWEDWIAFNDLINDVLDSNSVTADVKSLKNFRIRLGEKRRVAYNWIRDAHGPGHHEADMPGKSSDFEDRRAKGRAA